MTTRNRPMNETDAWDTSPLKNHSSIPLILDTSNSNHNPNADWFTISLHKRPDHLSNYSSFQSGPGSGDCLPTSSTNQLGEQFTQLAVEALRTELSPNSSTTGPLDAQFYDPNPIKAQRFCHESRRRARHRFHSQPGRPRPPSASSSTSSNCFPKDPGRLAVNLANPRTNLTSLYSSESDFGLGNPLTKFYTGARTVSSSTNPTGGSISDRSFQTSHSQGFVSSGPNLNQPNSKLLQTPIEYDLDLNNRRASYSNQSKSKPRHSQQRPNHLMLTGQPGSKTSRNQLRRQTEHEVDEDEQDPTNYSDQSRSKKRQPSMSNRPREDQLRQSQKSQDSSRTKSDCKRLGSVRRESQKTSILTDKQKSKYAPHPIERILPGTQPNGIGFYHIQGTIGAGNFSQVKQATHVLTKELVAIKVLDKTRMDASTRRLLSREISILECLHHPNIIRLYEVIETLTRLHLVMEYVAGGDLNKRITKFGKLSEPEAKIVFAQLVAAVNHLHERNIIHRDIKAENILFTHEMTLTNRNSTYSTQPESTLSGTKPNRTSRHQSTGSKVPFRKWLRNRSHSKSNKDRNHLTSSNSIPKTNSSNQIQTDQSSLNCRANSDRMWSSTDSTGFCPDHYRVKLVDFGFSKLTRTSDQKLTTFCGSPAYAAPELFEAQSYQGGPVDMWALGIVLFFIITGILPYRGSTVGQVRKLVLENRGLSPPDWLSVSVTDLYHKLTSRNPMHRPTAQQLIYYAQSSRQDKPSDPGSGSAGGKQDSWMNWLGGQQFPKALPRFNRCPPLLPSSKPGTVESVTNPDPNPLVCDQTEIQLPNSVRTTPTTATTTTTTTTTTSDDSSSRDLQHPRRSSHLQGRKVEFLTSASVNRLSSVVDDLLNTNEEAELEAARLLLNLGITTEEMDAAKNLEARSAVTGAYRIMLHKVHRSRRLSRLDQSDSQSDKDFYSLNSMPRSETCPIISSNQFPSPRTPPPPAPPLASHRLAAHHSIPPSQYETWTRKSRPDKSLETNKDMNRRSYKPSRLCHLI